MPEGDKRSAKTPCSCSEETASSNLAVGRMLTHLGQFLTDVGRLLSDGSEGSPESRQDQLGTFMGHDLPRRYQSCECVDDPDHKLYCCELRKDPSGKRYGCNTLPRCKNRPVVSCECHLFRVETKKEDAPWDHRADPGEFDTDDIDETKYTYRCICVRDSHRGKGEE